MDNLQSKGPVSFGLVSLQLQIKTLLEDCGGEHAVELMDMMCDVPGEELRATLMRSFINVVERLQKDGHFPKSLEGRIAADLEQELYDDILAMLHGNAVKPKDDSKPFAVLNGGKSPAAARPTPTPNRVVDFQAHRLRRQPPIETHDDSPLIS